MRWVEWEFQAGPSPRNSICYLTELNFPAHPRAEAQVSCWDKPETPLQHSWALPKVSAPPASAWALSPGSSISIWLSSPWAVRFRTCSGYPGHVVPKTWVETPSGARTAGDWAQLSQELWSRSPKDKVSLRLCWTQLRVDGVLSSPQRAAHLKRRKMGRLTHAMVHLNWLACCFSEGHIIVLWGVSLDFAPSSSSLCQYLIMTIELIDVLACPFLTNWLCCIIERLDLC